MIAGEPDISLFVAFEHDFSAGRYYDPGFGVDVEWDVPLRDGYESRLLAECDARHLIKTADAVWVHGWATPALHAVIDDAHAAGRPVPMRGENWSGAMPNGPWPRSWLKNIYLGRIFARCRAFLAVGSRNRAYYEAHGVAPDRIFEMPYAVDNDFFTSRATAAAAADVRARHDIPDDRKIVLYAGKLTARKHADHLLAAWQQAQWVGHARPVLLIVGDGELRARLEREADSDIIFAGFRNQSEMPGYYAAADLFVLMSEREPWGLAVNEAMACGTGVVASDQVGAAHDLVDDTTGARLPVGDVARLAHALPDLLQRSESLGRAARARIAGWDFAADIIGLKAALEATL